jgi:hypothetical protein
MKRRDVHRVLVGKHEGMRPLGRPKLRWEDSLNMVGGQIVSKVLVGKPEGKRPLGRPRRRSEDNMKKNGGQRCAEDSGGEI